MVVVAGTRSRPVAISPCTLVLFVALIGSATAAAEEPIWANSLGTDDPSGLTSLKTSGGQEGKTFTVMQLLRDMGCYPGPPSSKPNQELQRIQRNPDPVLHPFAREREYVRTVNAVKMDKIFAKPLVAAVEAHYEMVRSMRRSNVNPMILYSGSCDGEVVQHDLTFTKIKSRWKAHQGFVRSIVESLDGKHLFTCGDDKSIRQWRVFADARVTDRNWNSAARS